jgi:DNA-binding NtrC family response regulator/tetratricopeptide (TPR) repeat protein/energy-coupling factor transporter ATP-binding protein EcfA2
MESVRAFRRNLEPFEDDRPAGPWHLAGHTDLVSERRYLVSWSPVDSARRAGAGIFHFRCESAAAIAPDGCLPVLELAAQDGRIELLTAYAAPLESCAPDDASVMRVLEDVASTLAHFEAHAFHATGLQPGLVGLSEDGRALILPGAYVFAPPGDARRGITAATARGEALASHLAAFLGIARVLATRASESLAERLRDSRAQQARGVDEAFSIMRGGTVSPAAEGVPSPRPATPGAALQAIESGQVVEITGSERSGKTTALVELLGWLRDRGRKCRWIDEWDAGVAVRRRTGARESDRDGDVWFVDDGNERPLLHAAICEHVSAAGGLVVVNRAGDSKSDAFRAGLAQRATHGVHTVVLDAEWPAREPRAPLDAQSSRILELLSVADIPLPFDLLRPVFPGAERDLHRCVHALSGAGLVAIDARPLPPSGALTVVLTVPSCTLAREVVDGIPDPRRRNLHRTIARLADERAPFAPMFVYRHLVQAGDVESAAATAVPFVRESTRALRAPFLETLVHDLIDGGGYKGLPYGERLLLLTRLGDDLLARGRQSEAEALLKRARKMIPTGEELRAHAPLYSEAMRLLADAWSGRGQLKQALDLLDDTRDEIASYLSLADQARLLNDIGWLQYRLGDYPSCVDSCKFTTNTLNPNEHPLVVAQALNLLGVVAFNTSRYDEAVSYYEQGAFLREREKDQNALAGSYNNLALAHQAKGEYDKALEHLHKSIEIKRAQNNEAGIAGGYLNLALLYLEVHNFDEAERRCRESLRISSALGLAQLVAENHNTLGDIVLTRGQLDEAEAYYQRALEHARRLSTVSEEMGAQKRLAKLYLRKGRLDDARAAIDEASRLARQVGSKYEQAQTEDIFGELQAAGGRSSEAVDHFERAAALYATLSKYRLAAGCFARAGLACAGAGGTLEAKRYLDRAQDLVKSRIGQEIPEEIVTLQHALREQLLPSGVSGTGSQKLLYAFYELSSLADYADDKSSFFRRIIHVFRELTGAAACALVLLDEDGNTIGVSASGDQEPVEDVGLRALLARSLQLGTVLHPESAEATGLFARASLPHAVAAAASDGHVVIVPMKSLGKDLGCVLLTMPAAMLPRTKEDIDFLSCIGRHVAGGLRLSLHLDERSHKEETLERELNELGAPVAERHRFQSMIGRDETMRKVFRIVEKIKDMDTGILIFGESGTGKTELARTIHYNSPRRRHVFQSIHCAEIPTSLLESELFGHERGAFTGAAQRKLGRCEIADGGTVFLDDVNVMPVDTQAKLLHYLETKSFTRLGGTQKISTDVRVIAASNEDLERLVKEGRFREDLYYRLKVVQIELPPLRDRQDDMILISQDFLKKRCQAAGKPLKRLSTETIKLFQQYRWPGNVRELQNVLEQIVLLCDDDIVEPSSLPEDFLRRAARGGKQRWQSLEQLAQQMVESGGYSDANPLMPQVEALLASKMSIHLDNKTRAAGLLGITKPTLYARLRGYNRLK